MITINSQLDMTPGAIPVVIHRSQYDSDFSIIFTLFARTGDFTIASGTTAKVRGTKKSGTGYSADATIDVSAKTVTVTGDQQMTVASGQNIFEIVLLSGTSELCSANFILDVERAALDMDTITDETVARELDNLEQFVNEAESAATRAEQAAASFATDTTLSVSGKPADAKATGDAITAVENKVYGTYITPTASGSIAHFTDGADGIPIKDVTVSIEPVQAGSGDPSPENVRPITGWTGAKVTRTGKNLCPRLTGRTINGITFTSNADGSLTVSGTATSEALSAPAATASVLAGYPVLAKGTYYLSGGNGVRLYAQARNRDASVATVTISRNQLNNFSITGTRIAMFTVTKPCCIYVRADILSGETINATAYPMIHLASDTDDTYEPYSVQTYDITFPTEAGTVYGGTLDVTKGELVVDRICHTYEGGMDNIITSRSIDSSAKGLSIRTAAAYNHVVGGNAQDSLNLIKPLCDKLKTTWFLDAISATNCYAPQGNWAPAHIIKVDGLTTTDEYDAWCAENKPQMSWLLATPITYHLTPQEITSLLGTNNVWADTGDSEVEYRANTELWVQRKITEAVAAVLNS